MNFSNKGTKDQIKRISSKTEKVKTKAKLSIFKLMLVAAIVVAVIVTSTGVGAVKGVLDAAPAIESIDVSPLGSATSIYDADNYLIETLVQSGSNREPVSYTEIPDVVRNAFVAIEDSRFWKHNGIDLRGIFRAAYIGLSSQDFSEGASTITQQLIKNNVLNGGWETSMGSKVERKLQEQYLAIQLEKVMSKEIILENYLNTINLGNNTLGVQAAANRYFDKDVWDLTLSEATVLAAITSNPTSYNPITYPDDNRIRREIVLNNMVEQNYITEAQKADALADDDVYNRIQEVNTATVQESSAYTYFVDALIDQVMADLIDMGYTKEQATNLLYSGGLKIYSTQSPSMQRIVDEEISNPENYAVEQYGLSYQLTVQKQGEDEVINYSAYSIRDMLQNSSEEFYFESDTERTLANKMIFYTRERAEEVISTFKRLTIGEGDDVQGESIEISLQPQTSFVLIDQTTGEVKALSGGRGEKLTSRSLNRATSTVRHPGSAFKIISTFAPALETAGATLGTTYYDVEYIFDGRPMSNWWSGGTHVGYANIRNGIIFSMNIIAVKSLMETVSPQLGVEFAKDMGITTLSEGDIIDGKSYDDFKPSLALGGLTYGVTNLELTNSFAAIANRGTYIEPILYTKILDNTGNILIDKTDVSSRSKTVLRESTAYLLTSAMEESTELRRLYDLDIYSTSQAAKLENMSTAGKSGTSTADNDLWFVGYTPYYTAGIWEGYDENYPLTQQGGNEHKLIWNKIMTRIHEGLENISFAQPASVVKVEICAKSGKLAIEGVCENDPRGSMAYEEYFEVGTEPTEYCDHHTAVTVCSESHYAPTIYCPEVTQTIYMLIDNADNTGDTADSQYILPSNITTQTCPIHTSPAETETSSETEEGNTNESSETGTGGSSQREGSSEGSSESPVDNADD